MSSQLGDQFQMLRSRVETSIEPPYHIMVSSALKNDGADACALGLAGTLATAGYNAALVRLDDASAQDPVPVAAFDDPSLLDRYLTVSKQTGLWSFSFSAAGLAAQVTKDKTKHIVQTLSQRFDALVFEASALARSGPGILFARQCNALILTTRDGRSVREDDHDTINVVRAEDLPFLGIVRIDARTIRDMKALRKELYDHAPSVSSRMPDVGVISHPIARRV